jgi:hypothetical protein
VLELDWVVRAEDGDVSALRKLGERRVVGSHARVIVGDPAFDPAQRPWRAGRIAALEHAAMKVGVTGMHEPAAARIDGNRRVPSRVTLHRQREDFRRQAVELPDSGHAFPNLAGRGVCIPSR